VACVERTGAQRKFPAPRPHLEALRAFTLHPQTTLENIKAPSRRQDLIPISSMSKTSHCFAEKKVEGPTGGPRSGGTTIRLCPPGFIVLRPISNPKTKTSLLKDTGAQMRSSTMFHTLLPDVTNAPRDYGNGHIVPSISKQNDTYSCVFLPSLLTQESQS
jgi:hypothetical protein